MENLKSYFLDDKNGAHKRESFLIKYHSDLLNDILNYKINLNKNYPLIQKIYNYIFALNEVPKCYCGNEVKFNETINKGYRKYCSTKCGRNDPLVKDKIRKTNFEKYGVDAPLQSKLIQDKQKETNIKKYGVENPQKNSIIKNKTKQTNIKKYGVENPFQSEIIKDKIKQTNLKKYNVENVSKLTAIKEKKKETSRINYGQDYYTQTNEYKKRQANTFLKKINNLDISVFDLDNLIFLVKNHCEKHEEFLIKKDTLYNRYFVSKQNNICTECLPPERTHDSNIFNEIKKFLLKYNINFIENDRNVVKPYEIDLYLPDHNFGIEINGSYYHSDFYKTPNYHQNKTLLARKHNIFIFHLWDFDYYNNKNLILSMLLSKLSLIENKIYARNTKIREIEDNVCKEFLNKNHIQKWCVSRYRYGLYCDNKLISVMTFGKLRNNLNSAGKEGQFELLRFCSEQNMTIVGGAQKLLNFFEKNHNVTKIISYSNNDISNGNLYKILGFDLIKETKPTYWWIKHMVKYNRYNFRKDRLIQDGFDANKTEDEIMKERGYLKVYNSGNQLYEKLL